MTTYTFPSITPSSNTFELVTNTRTFQSPLTNSVQTVARKGSLWKASLRFNNLTGDNRAEMQAFLTKLNGQQHRFLLQDHGFVRRGNAPGVSDAIVVNGAGQTGSILLARDANLTVTDYFKSGDYIAFNNELHIVTADVDTTGTGTFLYSLPAREIVIGKSYTIESVGTTDFTTIGAADNNIGTTFTATGFGSGTGTVTQAGIPISPPIRKPTDDGDAIDYLYPVLGVFMLAGSTSWDTQPGRVSNFTIEAVEDVLA
jgi:hypothetical protein